MSSTKSVLLVAVFVTVLGVSMSAVIGAGKSNKMADIKDIHPVDMCLFACNMCFGKETLLRCANEVCLQTLGEGKSLANDLWLVECPGLEMFFK